MGCDWRIHAILLIPNLITLMFMQDLFTFEGSARLAASCVAGMLKGRKGGCSGQEVVNNVKTAATTVAGAAASTAAAANAATNLPGVQAMSVGGVDALPRKNQGPKFLDDKSFEHLTQAATGSTTGDWLVYFYSASACEEDDKCKQVVDFFRFQQPIAREWCNMAFVNTDATPNLNERFGFPDEHLKRSDHKLPKIMFFRQGRMFEVETSLKSIIQEFAKFKRSPDGKNPDPTDDSWDEAEMYKIHLGLDPEKDPIPLVKYLMARQYGRTPQYFVPPQLGFFQWFAVKALEYKIMPQVTYPYLNKLGVKFENTREHKEEL